MGLPGPGGLARPCQTPSPIPSWLLPASRTLATCLRALLLLFLLPRFLVPALCPSLATLGGLTFKAPVFVPMATRCLGDQLPLHGFEGHRDRTESQFSFQLQASPLTLDVCTEFPP